ncbi:MAG: DUF4160 domain-containing protein [Candidatus Hydrogenedentes bacterium]|nr:DUF4160 domain-containing protein [Candidatus Hydrogenedentota bacterium]
MSHPHLHVRKESKEAKYWLAPVRIARPGRFRAVELHEIERIIRNHHEFLLNAWREEQEKRADR